MKSFDQKISNRSIILLDFQRSPEQQRLKRSERTRFLTSFADAAESITSP